MTDKSVIYYQRKQLRELWYGKPKFNIGNSVVVRKEAGSVYGKWFNEQTEEWENRLIGGFDECREPLRGKVGVIVAIWSGKNGNLVYFTYRVKFGKRVFTMAKEWLRRK